MQVTTHWSGADFVLDATGCIQRNAQGDAVETALRTAKRAHHALDLSWVGACLAGLFLQYPWLQGMTLTLSASAEYDDQGGTYHSVSSRVSEVEATIDTALLGDLMPDGVFEPDVAEDAIESALQDIDYELYTTLNPAPDHHENLCLRLHRNAIGHLLNGTSVSGTEALRVLCPEHARQLQTSEATPFAQGN